MAPCAISAGFLSLSPLTFVYDLVGSVYTKRKSQCSLLPGTKAYQTRLCSCITFSCFSNRTPPLFQDEVTWQRPTFSALTSCY
ncbi:hypothetical protein K523DRAFT_64959 [Schizophyllum commune Tattone D]|nr:hypothetical protein K523DRAFT_64959 [Schizophyllum commune Tattone D]